ncbi:hypothetical protein CN490_23000 [Bacillus cereus]|nr:hypothetical protein CN490_23000 [Bacillus cereus]
MKLTLFTISNEQIKEQLSKLQTKVESLENVKDVQDKIISAKDSQITFLQGEISTIITWGSIAIGIITALAAVIYSYIKSLEEKAKDKIEEAESTLQTATEQLTEIANARQQIETNLTESDAKIEKLDSLISESNEIATVAQEKLDELTEKHESLSVLSNNLIINQKANVLLNSINTNLALLGNTINYLKDRLFKPHLKPKPEEIASFNELFHQHSILKMKHLSFESNLNNAIKDEQAINVTVIEEIASLQADTTRLNIRLFQFTNELVDDN